jgi:hypothetical protein
MAGGRLTSKEHVPFIGSIEPTQRPQQQRLAGARVAREDRSVTGSKTLVHATPDPPAGESAAKIYGRQNGHLAYAMLLNVS